MKQFYQFQNDEILDMVNFQSHNDAPQEINTIIHATITNLKIIKVYHLLVLA